jgi:hypothetical protein
MRAIQDLARRARIDQSTHAEPVQHDEPTAAHRFGLTDRELDVLRLLGQGKTNPEIVPTSCANSTPQWCGRMAGPGVFVGRCDVDASGPRADEQHGRPGYKQPPSPNAPACSRASRRPTARPDAHSPNRASTPTPAAPGTRWTVAPVGPGPPNTPPDPMTVQTGAAWFDSPTRGWRSHGQVRQECGRTCRSWLTTQGRGIRFPRTGSKVEEEPIRVDLVGSTLPRLVLHPGHSGTYISFRATFAGPGRPGRLLRHPGGRSTRDRRGDVRGQDSTTQCRSERLPRRA